MSLPAPVDPRVELALERTTLAWVRTGLSMMGFGFVVARFGLFLRELATSKGNLPTPTHGLSLGSGVGLVALGVVVLVIAAVRHARLLRSLRAGTYTNLSAGPGVFVAATLALLGLAMAVYLVVTSR